MALAIRLLGPPQVEIDGRALVVDTRKAVALLAYVSVVGRPVARDTLADLLWPDSPPEDARGALRRTLSVLRSGLGGDWLAVDRQQVSLASDGVSLDVAQFRRAVVGGGTRSRLAAAVAAYRGDFLEGFTLRDSAPWDEWQALEAEALRGELAGALRRLADLEAAEGRFPAAIAAARRLVTLDPLDEGRHRLLIRLHAQAGDRGAAIRAWEACVRVLDSELGVEPEPETAELHRGVVSGDVGVAAPPASDARGVTVSPEPEPALEAAAVLGEPFDPELVVAMLDEPADATLGALERLARTGVLLEPRESVTATGYRFAREEERVRLLESVGLARRRRLERRAAAAHDAAAARAARASRHGEAAAHLRAAIATGHGDQAALLARLGDAETAAGRYGEALAAYEQGAAAAEPSDIAGFERRLGSLHLRRGALELAELHLSAALARLPPVPAPGRSAVLADRSLVAMRRGDAAVAADLAREALTEARASADVDGEARAENVLALLARRAGDMDRARRHLQRSLERSGLSDRPDARVAALNNLALLERVAGNLDDALALTEEALRRCVASGDRHREAALRNNRADLLHALGRPGEAQEELVRSVTAFAEVGDRGAFEPEIWKLVDW